MIDKKEVQHIAKLARLGLNEEEIEKFQKELSSVFNYIEKLKEVDIKGIEPTSHSVLLENITREDEINEKLKIKNTSRDISRNNSNYEKLLDLAPETKEGFVKVKPVF